MKSSHILRSGSWLLASSLLMAVVLMAGLGGQPARAASAYLLSHPSGQVRPFAGCAPCISQASPDDKSTVTPGPDGKVTISATAQLNDNYTTFTLSLDQAAIDQAQIQITATDPTQPTLQYSATLTPGPHHAFVEVSDASGPVASFGWDFTVAAAPTPTVKPTTPPSTGGSGGSGGSSGSSIFAPKTLSIILFSIAGLGLLVIIFIAGMWYSGSRQLRKNP
ncbi:MAG TPA: hypothetical protein VFU32_02040 [Ktedonobacterales bacterium]|nr:hypothetical protein [Ktedonobacterales bacterium]